jgi:predicted nuclease of predicted toxin-antitoxin system
MQFLADESCDGLVVRALRQAGHDVTYVAEFAPGIEDDEVLKRSVDEERILITEDLDFCDMVFRDKKTAYAIILIRVTQHRLKANRVLKLLKNQEQDLIGNLTSLSVDDARMRELP